MEAIEARPRRRRRRWILLLLLVLGGVFWLLARRSEPILSGTFLVVDLEKELATRPVDGLQQLLGGQTFDLLSLRHTLNVAAEDLRVSGLVVRVGQARLGGGMVGELRELIERFRQSEKFVLAYANGPDTQNYLLATAAEQIVLDPATSLNVTGVRLISFFLKDVFARYGVQADLLRVGRFKSSFEQFALDAPTAEYNEEMHSVVDSIYTTTIEKIALARGLQQEEVRHAVDRAPLSTEEALGAKLVDSLLYRDEIEAHLKNESGREAHLMSIETYHQSFASAQTSPQHVAVISVIGTLVEGESREMALTGVATGDRTIERALEQAEENDDVTGIILYIDSPGGLVTASETVWRLVDQVQKPVVACLGNRAASGGYYVASAADKIFAQSSTLTGSIGVFGGKVVIKDLLDDHRVAPYTYARGENAAMYDFTEPFTPEQRLRLARMMQMSYDTFLRRVSDKRSLTADAAIKAAEGRLWTGKQARDQSLVDALGGLDMATEEIRQQTASPVEVALTLRAYPPPPTAWEVLSGNGGHPLVRASLPRARLAAELHAWLVSTRLFNSPRGLALMPFTVDVR